MNTLGWTLVFLELFTKIFYSLKAAILSIFYPGNDFFNRNYILNEKISSFDRFYSSKNGQNWILCKKNFPVIPNGLKLKKIL